MLNCLTVKSKEKRLLLTLYPFCWMTFLPYTHFHDDGFAVCMQETTIMKIRTYHYYNKCFMLFGITHYGYELLSIVPALNS